MIIPLRPHPWDAFGPPQPLGNTDLTTEQLQEIEKLEKRIGELRQLSEDKLEEAEGLKYDAQELEREAGELDAEADDLEDELRELEG